MAIPLEGSWASVLSGEFEEEYMRELLLFLEKEKAEHVDVYPPEELIFNAFNHTPFEKVKVVIVGQDPYIGKGQAHGLSFSVQKGIKPPPSLKNIFKELEQDIEGFSTPEHGDLTAWADQGVFLLNAILTVKAGASLSHQNIGWENFTNKAIMKLSAKRSGIVFLLWGKFAQSKAALIDLARHHVLTAAHPSPFSARNGFFGCRHFSKTNELLMQAGHSPIDWQL